MVVATWEGYDDTNSSHVLNDISERNINGLFKNEMSGILANTPGTRFTVQDAQIRANKRVKNTSGWKSFFNGGDNALMNRFNQSVNNIGDKASQFWNNVKSLF